MRDPEPNNSRDSQKYWYTGHFEGNYLLEYDSATHYREDIVDRRYKLGQHQYYGTGHTVYRGSFYYHSTGQQLLLRYDLKLRSVVARKVIKGSSYGSNNYVYSTEYNYYDFAVDENGLWVIYANDQPTSSLMVSKMNPETLDIIKTWELTVNHRSYGNGFIICGVLYLVKDPNRLNTHIDYAYDLYKSKEIKLNIKFTNPYQMNNMISYNPNENLIYGWDMGNQITYPMLF